MKSMYVWIASRLGLRCVLRCFKSFWQVNNVVDVWYIIFLHSTMNTFSRRSLGSQCESQKMSTFQAVSESRKMSTILSDDDDDGDSHGDDDDDDDDDGCRNNFQVGNCWKAWSEKSTMWNCYWTLLYERSTFCLIGTCFQLTCQWSVNKLSCCGFLNKKF